MERKSDRILDRVFERIPIPFLILFVLLILPVIAVIVVRTTRDVVESWKKPAAVHGTLPSSP